MANTFFIKMALDKDFVKALKKMKRKYGEPFEYLNGLHESQLNHTDFIDNFTKKNAVDVTIDSNANSARKDITSLKVEKEKSNDKLLAFNKIFYEHKKYFGLAAAQQWLEFEWSGRLYLHDAPSSTYFSYCFAYDSESLAKRGLFFIDHGKATPAQHFTTFCDHTLEFVSWVSNKSSGRHTCPFTFFPLISGVAIAANGES